METVTALISVGSVFVPPCLIGLAVVGWDWARNRGRPDLARRFVIAGIAAVGLTVWAWSSFRFPID